MKHIIYYNKFKTSNLYIINNFSPSIGVSLKTNQFGCSLEDGISENHNVYIDLSSTTLSRQLTINLSDTSSITQHSKTFLPALYLMSENSN